MGRGGAHQESGVSSLQALVIAGDSQSAGGGACTHARIAMNRGQCRRWWPLVAAVATRIHSQTNFKEGATVSSHDHVRGHVHDSDFIVKRCEQIDVAV